MQFSTVPLLAACFSQLVAEVTSSLYKYLTPMYTQQLQVRGCVCLHPGRGLMAIHMTMRQLRLIPRLGIAT